MGELYGVTNGVTGMLFGATAGLLVIWQAWRRKPWDIHDEESYSEPERITLGAVAPSLILLFSLLTLLLGLGALDKGIPPLFAIIGDLLGLVTLPFSAVYVLKGLK